MIFLYSIYHSVHMNRKNINAYTQNFRYGASFVFTFDAIEWDWVLEECLLKEWSDEDMKQHGGVFVYKFGILLMHESFTPIWCSAVQCSAVQYSLS